MCIKYRGKVHVQCIYNVRVLYYIYYPSQDVLEQDLAIP